MVEEMDSLELALAEISDGGIDPDLIVPLDYFSLDESLDDLMMPPPEYTNEEPPPLPPKPDIDFDWDQHTLQVLDELASVEEGEQQAQSDRTSTFEVYNKAKEEQLFKPLYFGPLTNPSFAFKALEAHWTIDPDSIGDMMRDLMMHQMLVGGMPMTDAVPRNGTVKRIGNILVSGKTILNYGKIQNKE